LENARILFEAQELGKSRAGKESSKLLKNGSECFDRPSMNGKILMKSIRRRSS
jgi:hypothetical protein